MLIDSDRVILQLEDLSTSDYVYYKDKLPYHRGYRAGLGKAKHIIQDMTPRATGKGHWVLHDIVCPESYECSICHRIFDYDRNQNCDRWLYCPGCGSEMRIRR